MFMEFDEQMQARLATVPVPQTVGKAVGQTGKVAAGHSTAEVSDEA